jgi:hypothetical protein
VAWHYHRSSPEGDHPACTSGQTPGLKVKIHIKAGAFPPGLTK